MASKYLDRRFTVHPEQFLKNREQSWRNRWRWTHVQSREDMAMEHRHTSISKKVKISIYFPWKIRCIVAHSLRWAQPWHASVAPPRILYGQSILGALQTEKQTWHIDCTRYISSRCSGSAIIKMARYKVAEAEEIHNRYMRLLVPQRSRHVRALYSSRNIYE